MNILPGRPTVEGWAMAARMRANGNKSGDENVSRMSCGLRNVLMQLNRKLCEAKFSRVGACDLAKQCGGGVFA